MQPPGYRCKWFSKFNASRRFVVCAFCILFISKCFNINHCFVKPGRPGLPPILFSKNKSCLLRPHIINSARTSMQCNPTAPPLGRASGLTCVNLWLIGVDLELTWGRLGSTSVDLELTLVDLGWLGVGLDRLGFDWDWLGVDLGLTWVDFGWKGLTGSHLAWLRLARGWQICICTCIFACIFVCIRTCICTCICICICNGICFCIYVCTCICICIWKTNLSACTCHNPNSRRTDWTTHSKMIAKLAGPCCPEWQFRSPTRPLSGPSPRTTHRQTKHRKRGGGNKISNKMWHGNRAWKMEPLSGAVAKKVPLGRVNGYLKCPQTGSGQIEFFTTPLLRNQHFCLPAAPDCDQKAGSRTDPRQSAFF